MYESVIREKELAFDAQLSATEIVRRCERRMGELVREGQRDGTIRKPSRVTGRGNGRVDDIPKPRDFFSGDYERTESYVMAEAPAEQFEEAITEAREEGNLSRANVVRKVKGVKPKPAERSEWHHKRRHIDPRGTSYRRGSRGLDGCPALFRTPASGKVVERIRAGTKQVGRLPPAQKRSRDRIALIPPTAGRLARRERAPRPRPQVAQQPPPVADECAHGRRVAVRERSGDLVIAKTHDVPRYGGVKPT